MLENNYVISGMHCAACSSAIERFLGKQEAIEYVAVNLSTNKMLVKYNDDAISNEEIIALVEKLGYGCMDKATADALSAKEGKAARIKEEMKIKKQFREAIIAICFAVPLLYVSMLHMMGAPLPHFMDMHHSPIVYALVQLILTLPILICGRNFYINGFP